MYSYLPQKCCRKLPARLLSCLFLSLIPLLISGATIPSSTSLEVSLSEATGSRISHAGDPVKATVISPVFTDGKLVVPQGSIISGVIKEVGRLGLGVKHVTSNMRYEFDSLQLPDGTVVPIQAVVKQVETAKERVDAGGVVRGIYPTANLSSSLASYVIPLLWVDPHFGLPFLGIKVVIARSPDPEIYFPAATEFVLRTTAEANVPASKTPSTTISPLSSEDMADVHRILAKLPEQHTNRGRNHPSDLVNILFLGKRDAITRAFAAAGWSGAHRSSVITIYRMYHCMVQRIGYSMAPMGQLTLNGLRADAEYQKSLNTFSKRHHVRLWKQAEDEAWLSAATEDVSYRFRNVHLTHATDPMIDNERNKVLNDVAFTGCIDAAGLLPRATADQRESSIQTDGRIAVLRLNDCQKPRSIASQSSTVDAPPKPRAIQALIALRNDLIRTNPVFLAYNSVKLLCERHGSGSNTSDSPDRSSKRDLQTGWIRPSILDTHAHTD